MNQTLPSSAPRLQPGHDEISRRAQEIWENQGRPESRDEDIWFEAERSLQLQAPAVPLAPPPAASISSPPTLQTAPRTQAMATAKMPPFRASKNSGRNR